MTARHRKMTRRKGDAALSSLMAALRQTMAVIQEAEGFDQQMQSTLTKSDLAKRFPALNAKP